MNRILSKSKHLHETVTYSIEHSHQVKSFIFTRREGLFGFEYSLTDMDKKLTFFADHRFRTNLTPVRPIRIEPNRANVSCYYLRFQKPNYAPFSFTNVEDVWILIQKYTQTHVKKGMNIYIQTIFQFHSTDFWKVEAKQRYNGYLVGIHNLSMNKPIQRLQYKVANILKSQKPEPIDNAMEKLTQDGYSICIRLVIEGNEMLRKKVLDRIMLALNTQRFVNGWEYKEVIHKQKFMEDSITRTFPNQYKNQILCSSELNVYFGGGEAGATLIREEDKSDFITGSKPSKALS